MTPEQGQHLAAIGAGVVFLVGIVSMVLWRLEARLTRRRNALRFEPRRFALAIEDETDDEPTDDLTPYVCSYCHRNAGHNADCYAQRVQRRVDEIRIPREGQGDQP